MAQLIKHDGLARESLYRCRAYDTGYGTKEECSWCGQSKQLRNTARTYCFKYWVVKDDSLSGFKNYLKGKFCSQSCFNAYHNQ